MSILWGFVWSIVILKFSIREYNFYYSNHVESSVQALSWFYSCHWDKIRSRNLEFCFIQQLLWMSCLRNPFGIFLISSNPYTLMSLIEEHVLLIILRLFPTLFALIRPCSLNFFAKWFWKGCLKYGYFTNKTIKIAILNSYNW